MKMQVVESFEHSCPERKLRLIYFSKDIALSYKPLSSSTGIYGYFNTSFFVLCWFIIELILHKVSFNSFVLMLSDVTIDFRFTLTVDK